MLRHVQQNEDWPLQSCARMARLRRGWSVSGTNCSRAQKCGSLFGLASDDSRSTSHLPNFPHSQAPRTDSGDKGHALVFCLACHRHYLSFRHYPSFRQNPRLQVLWLLQAVWRFVSQVLSEGVLGLVPRKQSVDARPDCGRKADGIATAARGTAGGTDIRAEGREVLGTADTVACADAAPGVRDAARSSRFRALSARAFSC